LIIEVLYFDGCPYHGSTVDAVREAAAHLGADVELREVEVRDDEDARRLRFLGSPTVLVDGVDIEPEARTRTDYAMSCRLYGAHGLLPREMIAAALVSGQVHEVR
jgi:hypothetical protein